LATDAVAVASLKSQTLTGPRHFLGWDENGEAAPVRDIAVSPQNKFNIAANAFRIARTNSFRSMNMVDGYADEFIDESNVDSRTPLRGIAFDGTNDYLTRGADLTSISDGKEGTISVWVKFLGGDGTLQILLNQVSGTDRFTVSKNSSNKIVVSGSSAAPAVVLTLTSTTSVTAASGWVHILASWDLLNSTGHLYLNGVDDQAAGATLTNTDIDYTSTNWGIGATTAGASNFDGELAELYFETSYLDVSVTATREKFIDVDGHPVNLGGDGSLPAGTQPILYMSGDLPGFITNKGSGGGFTETGTLRPYLPGSEKSPPANASQNQRYDAISNSYSLRREVSNNATILNEDFRDGNGWVDERSMLCAEFIPHSSQTEVTQQFTALNDVVVSRGGIARAVNIQVSINNKTMIRSISIRKEWIVRLAHLLLGGY